MPGAEAMFRTLLLLVLLSLGRLADAGTLLVGPDQQLTRPSAAAQLAQDGDVVLIEPGEYYDCAIWSQNRLVIAGTAPGVVITDTTCQGKALFVVTGDGTTVRDLILARARVPDGNGAGIRLEGQGLNLERVRFINNQVGILAGGSSLGPIRILGCHFEGGGLGGERPLFAARIGPADLLRVEGSTFHGIEGGQISTAAARTELVGNQIASGLGEEPAVAVLASAGLLIMQDNRLFIGPSAPRPAAAVLAMGHASPELRRNQLVNTSGKTVALLLDWSWSDPVLEANQVAAGDETLSSRGLWRHRLATLYHETKGTLRALAGRLKRLILSGQLGQAGQAAYWALSAPLPATSARALGA